MRKYIIILFLIIIKNSYSQVNWGYNSYKGDSTKSFTIKEIYKTAFKIIDFKCVNTKWDSCKIVKDFIFATLKPFNNPENLQYNFKLYYLNGKIIKASKRYNNGFGNFDFYFFYHEKYTYFIANPVQDNSDVIYGVVGFFLISKDFNLVFFGINDEKYTILYDEEKQKNVQLHLTFNNVADINYLKCLILLDDNLLPEMRIYIVENKFFSLSQFWYEKEKIRENIICCDACKSINILEEPIYKIRHIFSVGYFPCIQVLTLELKSNSNCSIPIWAKYTFSY